MKKQDFWYDLPPGLIAQTPAEKRDNSRLLVLDRGKGAIDHRHFYEIGDYLRPGDCLVVNNSRVLPARLLGERAGGGVCEILLLEERGEGEDSIHTLKCRKSSAPHGGHRGDGIPPDLDKYDSRRSHIWECIVRPGRKLPVGACVTFGDGRLQGEIIETLPEGGRLVRFVCDGIFLEALEALGAMPLPPYITEKLDDPERYQTVYAKVSGSAAAPTAGLHFTPELLAALEQKGVLRAELTLHVGLGTFRPVKVDAVEDHVMHEERYSVSPEAAETVNRARAAGGRVIAVGTTSVRTLETVAKDGAVYPQSGSTGIFITPGHEFQMIDGLITNFHLPESTLMMLVSALAGRERILAAYQEAVREQYRFFSFGDAMLIM